MQCIEGGGGGVEDCSLKKYTPKALREHLKTKKVKQMTDYFDWSLIEDHLGQITNFNRPNQSLFRLFFAD